jgi:predicted MPP superfamily phosphohydrolase
MGNHDHWVSTTIITRALERIGVTVLSNSAVRRGPLVIGGLDDDFTGHANMAATLKAVGPDRRSTLMISHSPDPFPEMPRDIPLMLAGHTHCGQIHYPWGGTPATMSHYGQRFVCGRVDENGHSLIVTAGLGTSVLPFRFLVKPDVWLVTLVPPKP